jgi:hypothetical protein
MVVEIERGLLGAILGTLLVLLAVLGVILARARAKEERYFLAYADRRQPRPFWARRRIGGVFRPILPFALRRRKATRRPSRR